MKKLIVLAALSAVGSASATIYCSPDGNDAAAGTREAPKCSIQKVLAANTGETVVLLPGTYHLTDSSQKVEGENGALHVNGYGVLKGDTGNPADVVIDADGACEAVRIAGGYTLSGITIANGGNASGSAQSTMIGVNTDGTPSRHCTITNCIVRGFETEAGGSVQRRFAVKLAAGSYMYDTVFTDIRGKDYGAAVRAYNGAVMSGCRFEGIELTSTDKGNTCAVHAEKNVVITNCTFTGGTGTNPQLRAYGAEGEPCTVVGCTFTGNEASNDYGVCQADPYCVLTNCVFEGNSAQMGGALRARAATVVGCTFSNNSSAGRGGACLVANHDTVRDPSVFRNCTFSRNSAPTGGGAVYVGYKVTGASTYYVNGALDMADCLFTRNVAGDKVDEYSGGGAVMFQTGSQSGGLIDRCKFVANEANKYGGAVNWRFHMSTSDTGTPVVLRNCLFADNRTQVSGGQGGVGYLIGQGTARETLTNVVENCTFVGNAASSASNGHAVYQKFGNFRCANSLFASGQIVVTGNNPSGNYYKACYLPANPTQAGSGDSQLLDCLVGSDPKFVDAAAGDYSLAGGSPCVNKGVLLDWMDDAALDVAGGTRVVPKGGQPDIGCYERFVPSGFMLLVR